MSLCAKSRSSLRCTKIYSVWLHAPFQLWFFFSLLTVSIWLPDLCIIHRSVFLFSSFVQFTTNSIVHGDCFHWFLHSPCPPSPTSIPHHLIPLHTPYCSLIMWPFCEKQEVTHAFPLGFDQFEILTVAGLTYHYALTLWTSHILINWIIAIHG